MNINMRLINRIHHDVDEKCKIAIFKDWALEDDHLIFEGEKTSYDKFFPGSKIQQLEEFMDVASKDTYFSINSFRHENKKENDVWHLNAFALDFDFYKIDKYKELGAKQMYIEHIKDKLPLPASAVIDSGRGLYVIYIFKHSSRAMTSTYKAIYKSFLKVFKAYGLDDNAMKVTQIIRMPGTINSKSFTEVEIIEENETSYSMNNFFPFLPFTREEVKAQKKEKSNKRKIFVEYTHEQLTKSNKFKKNLAKAIIKDLETLIQLRNAAGYVEGYRELLIYVARKRVQFMNGSSEEEFEVAKKLNEIFDRPLPQKELIHVTKPYGKHKCPGIDKTMKLLQIDAEEEKSMKALCRKSIKDAKRNKRRKKHPLFNLTEKQLSILKRQTEVYALKEQLLTNAEIAKKLNQDPATITRDLQEIKNNPWRWKKSMRELFKEFHEFIKTDLFLKKTLFSKQQETLDWLKVCESVLE